MVKREIIEIEKTIKGFFKKNKLELNKIILFGSYAENKETDSSDIDLIIVSEDFRNKDLDERIKMIRGVNMELVRATQKPIDTLFYSDEEWEEGYSLTINAAKNNGIVIYE